jgi:hypothetical protein
MLQQGSAARCHGCHDLQLRMHFLSGLYGDGAGRALPELRRGACLATHSAGRKAGAASGVHGMGRQTGRLCRHPGIGGRPHICGRRHIARDVRAWSVADERCPRFRISISCHCDRVVLRGPPRRVYRQIEIDTPIPRPHLNGTYLPIDIKTGARPVTASGAHRETSGLQFRHRPCVEPDSAAAYRTRRTQ